MVDSSESLVPAAPAGPELGFNIDHVATLRQARRTYEPDPAWAAVEAQLAGAGCITIHLREDRRHIQDHDLYRVKSLCQVKLNLEMAATDEMVKIALQAKPDMVTLVPEGRLEVTTEGGLNVAGQASRIQDVVGRLAAAGIVASAFIDPEPLQIEASAQAGFRFCEIHTGPYAHLYDARKGDWSANDLRQALAQVADAGRRTQAGGMQFNAGHALNYHNVKPIAGLSGLRELHIGHSIVSRSLFVGLRTAVGEMVGAIKGAAKRT